MGFRMLRHGMTLAVLITTFVFTLPGVSFGAAVTGSRSFGRAPAPAIATTMRSVGSADDLAITGTPFPGIGFYYGGPAISFVSASGAFSALEPVAIYLGTVLTGTVLVTRTSGSTGVLKTSVPVPQVN